MKKLILSIAAICFAGIVNIYAQSPDAKAQAVQNPPASAAVLTTSGNVNTETTTQTEATTQTETATKEAAKPEVKKSNCSHSSKACCASKKSSSSKACNHGEAEKAENKSEKTENAKPTN